MTFFILILMQLTHTLPNEGSSETPGTGSSTNKAYLIKHTDLIFTF